MARQPNRGTIRKQPTSTAVDEPDESPEPKVGFFELLGQFSDEDWRGMKVYIYRLWPVIDRKEKDHFLSKIQHSFDEDFLLSTFGTGKYFMRLNNAKGATITTHAVSVYNTQHPPRVNPEEVVASDPENERYFKAWGKPEPPPDSNGGLVDIARAALLEGNRRPSLDPQILGLWEKTNAERDNLAQRLAEMSQKQPPASAVEPITMLREMLSVMREIQPPVPPAAPIDQIADAVATRLGVASRASGGGDPFSNWEKVQAFLERAGGVAAAVNPEGAAAGVAGDAAASWAPHIANIISEARAFVPELIQAWFAVRSSAAAAAVPNNNDGVLEMLPLDKRIETIFKAGFESMRRGVTGQQFAQWLCLSGEMPGGLEAFNFLKPAGAGGLVAMAATNPVGAQIVNDAAVRPQLDRFLVDFFSFNPAAGSAVASAA